VLRNALLSGRVVHRRSAPVAHEFQYPVWYLALDADHLDDLRLPSFAPISVRATDFLKLEGRVRPAICDALQRNGLPQVVARIVIVAQPRSILFYNPVVFYFCLNDDRIDYIVAQIHSTPWNERHTYVLDARAEDGKGGTFRFDKTFHVSPFASMDVAYTWRFSVDAHRTHVAMRLTERGLETLFTGLYLDASAFETASVRRVAWRRPLQGIVTLWRIYLNAALLFLKRAPVHPHPEVGGHDHAQSR
jgi:DUF1365 family protein